MELNIPEKIIAIYVKRLRKAEPYSSREEFKKNDFYDDKNEERIKRCDATVAKLDLEEHGIDFDWFMKEYVNNPDYIVEEHWLKG